MPPLVTNFGKNLKFLRRLKGLSQSELAKEVDLSRNNIASYESGMVEPNTLKFLRLCNFLGVDSQDMLDKILSENPVELVPVVPESELDQYLVDNLESFTRETNSMTKILEGYVAFYQMQKDASDSEGEHELYANMNNILDLFRSLLAANWNLIQSVFPSEEEE